jgi:hypothetical protein
MTEMEYGNISLTALEVKDRVLFIKDPKGELKNVVLKKYLEQLKPHGLIGIVVLGNEISIESLSDEQLLSKGLKRIAKAPSETPAPNALISG